MSTIKEFFNGNIYPYEMMTNSAESLAAERRIGDCLEKADKLIPKDEEGYFSDKVRSEICVLQGLTAEQAFELGFALGLRFTVECYSVL
ncbi:MAG: hypothetical protein IJY73_04335 [Oscillospiraceae bacterium]|nr:hypothetical protein [Oscillospiraceae bacterium]